LHDIYHVYTISNINIAEKIIWLVFLSNFVTPQVIKNPDRINLKLCGTEIEAQWKCLRASGLLSPSRREYIPVVSGAASLPHTLGERNFGVS
jgi:hypothetical protein